MQGLEIVMDIESLEVYEVIDHDKEEQTEDTIQENVMVSAKEEKRKFYQPSLFEAICLVNTS